MARLIFMGSPEMAVPSLKALITAGHEIPLVITQPDRPKGRGRTLSAPPIKVAAEALGLPILQPTKIKTPEFLQQLEKQQADGIIVVAYGRLLNREIIESTPWGCINLHFSLLPKYRGAACVAYALMNGDDETGVTTMLIDEGLDTGPLLLQWTEPLYPEDTTESVSRRLADLGAQQLVQTIAGLEQGRLRPVPQREEAASYAPLLQKDLGHVDWNQPAQKVFNLYRGLTPWPGLYGFLGDTNAGKRILLTQLRLDEKPGPSQEPGTLEIEEGKRLFIHAREGRLEILQLKPEGKKIVQAADFVRGLQSKTGLKLR